MAIGTERHSKFTNALSEYSIQILSPPLTSKKLIRESTGLSGLILIISIGIHSDISSCISQESITPCPEEVSLPQFCTLKRVVLAVDY